MSEQELGRSLIAGDVRDAELIASLYDIALEPERLDELVSHWTNRIDTSVGSQRPESSPLADLGVLSDERIMPHLSRVEGILQSMMISSEAVFSSIDDWVRMKNHAAIVFDRNARVVTMNAAADQAFRISPGAGIAELGLEEADAEFLRQCLVRQVNSSPRQRLLRLRQRGDSPPLVALVVDPLLENRDYVGVITSAVSWPGKLSGLLEASFGLTGAECDVLKDLTLGRNVREMAIETGRSEGTIRTHIHALLSKTETRTQVEVVRLALGLFDVASAFGTDDAGRPDARSLNNIYQTMMLSDGRRFNYLDLCDKGGKPFLLLPGNISLTRLPADAEFKLAQSGYRMIVPIRAGYGFSSPLPAGQDAADTGVADIVELLRFLKIGPVPIVCMVSDMRIATQLAVREEGLVTAIIGASAMLPLVEPGHFARLDKFTRFVMANGRAAPRTLGFIAMIFFIFAYRQGVKRFLELVLDGSEADRLALNNPDILDALIRGSHAILRPHFKAHVAWAQDIVAFTTDWRDSLLRCTVPITLLVGDQSPWVPIETVREFAARASNIDVIEFADTGQLLAYQYPEAILHQLQRYSTP